MSDRARFVRESLWDSLPVFAAYFPLGITWGVVWEQAGLSPVWGVLFSVFIYGATAQLLALSVIVAGGGLGSMLLTVVPVMLRNSFYTVALLDRLPRPFWVRLYTAFCLIDGPFAVAACKDKETSSQPWYLVTLMTVVHIYWVAGSVVGVWAGAYVPNKIEALDFVLPALLAVIVLEQVLKLGSSVPVLISVFVALTMQWLFGAAWMLPAIGLCIIASLRR